MSLPPEEDLDTMASLIAGVKITFASLKPEAKITVIGLVAQTDIANLLAEISRHLEDLDDVTEWFRKSRLYEGR